MADKAHTTLLLLAASEIIRADFSGPDTPPVSVLRQPRQAEFNAVESARIGLLLKAPCGRNLWVASDDVWNQTVALPSSAAGSLSLNELAAALAFEAEPLSGIPSSSAAVGFLPLPAPDAALKTTRDYSVVLLDAALREGLQQLAEKSGVTLRGIVSLKDLPLSTTAPDERTWLRACFERLTRTPPVVPKILPAARAIAPTRYWLTGAALLAVVIGGCWYYSRWVDKTVADAYAQVEKLREPQKKLDELKKKIATDSTALKKVETENTTRAALFKQVEEETAHARERLPAILDALKDERPSDVALQGLLAQDSELMRVDGLSLDASRADLFVTKLDMALLPMGMRAVPLSKSAQALAADGGPWKFSLQILNTGPQKAADSVAGQSPAPHREED